MTQTDELRALLDERGIEWQSGAFGDPRITYWKSNGVEWCAIEHDDGRLVVNMGIDVTPEQAVAATVGADYGIIFAPTLERPPETMVGETVYDAEGNAIGWIANATVGERTSRNERTASIVKVPRQSHVTLGHYECGGCGATIDAGDNFCRKCGARLKGAEE